MHAHSGILCRYYKPCFQGISNGMGSCYGKFRKKKKAYKTTCVITVPIFWNINTQAISQLVPICQLELQSIEQNPPFQVLHLVRSCPEDIWRFPGEHLCPLFTACSEFQNITLSFLAVLMGSDVKLAPLYHCPKAAQAPGCLVQQQYLSWCLEGGEGHRQEMTLQGCPADNSKSFHSLKSPFSGQGFFPFFSPLSPRSPTGDAKSSSHFRRGL